MDSQIVQEKFNAPYCPLCGSKDESRPQQCSKCGFCWMCDKPEELCDCEKPVTPIEIACPECGNMHVPVYESKVCRSCIYDALPVYD